MGIFGPAPLQIARRGANWAGFRSFLDPPPFYPSLVFFLGNREKEIGTREKPIGGVIDGPEDMSKTLQKYVRGFCSIYFYLAKSESSVTEEMLLRRTLSSACLFPLLPPSFPAKFVPWELPFPPPVKFQLPEGGRGRSKGGESKESNDCLIHLSALDYACQVSGQTNMYFSSNL